LPIKRGWTWYKTVDMKTFTRYRYKNIIPNIPNPEQCSFNVLHVFLWPSPHLTFYICIPYNLLVSLNVISCSVLSTVCGYQIIVPREQKANKSAEHTADFKKKKKGKSILSYFKAAVFPPKRSRFQISCTTLCLASCAWKLNEQQALCSVLWSVV
jgi:hypothetical protein